MTNILEALLDTATRISGEPLLVAHGCALLEHFTGTGYTYRAVNLKSGKSAFLCRYKNQVTTSGVDTILDKLRLCSVAEAGPLMADMPPDDFLSHSALAEILAHVFINILPSHGYAHREAQADLSVHILDVIHRRCISLAEGEVGSGKTLAYLIAAALAKRGRVNDFWLRGSYPNQNYADSAYMPVVISTSSIALQNAIAKDYIPEISRILMEHSIIKTPLSCVIRKGREHYLCEHRLCTYYTDTDSDTKVVLDALLRRAASIDLADVDGLTPYMKRRIGVTGRCGEDCPRLDRCRYLSHIKDVQSNRYDFQITNHNYLLADILRRKAGQPPLIPHYQAVIIDEGHKFLGAARQMYGVELDSGSVPEITGLIRSTLFRGDSGSKIWRKARKLYGQHKLLFSLLCVPNTDDDSEHATVVIDEDAERHIRNISLISEELLEMLDKAAAVPHHQGRNRQAIWLLKELREHAFALENHRDLILWMERGETESIKLCAIPKNLSEQLHMDFWNNGIPVILTSGTLSAAGSFERIKRSTGLDRMPPDRVKEIRKASPFNYRENALIYISRCVPFPDYRDSRYLAAVTEETERLVRVCYGHAAVLFTSYKAMDIVWERLTTRCLPFPMFRLDRGGVSAISGFKASNGGVLFASGAMWEGIDIPGDALTLLIIVRLPFSAPDPISEYERTLYGSMREYKNAVIIPDMLVRYRQGFGRPFRLVSDTGIVAIFDSRACWGAAYHNQILKASPDCRITDRVDDISRFLMEKKAPDYFSLDPLQCCMPQQDNRLILRGG